MANAPVAFPEPAPTAEEILDVMSNLDGTSSSVISMMTGFSAEDLNELGGVPES